MHTALKALGKGGMVASKIPKDGTKRSWTLKGSGNDSYEMDEKTAILETVGA